MCYTEMGHVISYEVTMSDATTYLQLPFLLHVLVDQSFLEVFKRPHLGLHVLGPVAGPLQQTHQAIHLLGVVVNHLHGTGVALPTSYSVRLIFFSFDGVVVTTIGVQHGESKASQVVAALPEQIQAIALVRLLQVILCFFSGDVAVEERQRVYNFRHSGFR